MISLPFLKEIAAILLQPGQYNLSETCVVFPNKRARLYLSKYMGELTDKPVWAPHYLTINELMEGMSPFVLADRLTILFELFEVYKLATGSAESFDTFYPYADPLLADFDEIDKYLANAGDLFSNLAGLKAIEGKFNYLSEDQIAAIRRFWNTFDPENTSEGQKTFISLWNVLPEMYAGLRERLAKKGLAYEGMVYRSVADDLSGNNRPEGLDRNKYLFIGFNALNKCEEKLFRHIKNLGKAEFYWDYDSWYTNNDIHEAGYFIRKNLRDFPPTREINHNSLAAAEKNIWFLPVPSNTGQAGALPYIFEKLGIQEAVDSEHVALVLADENLLIPALYAIPETVSNLNITMGYPITGSAVFNMIDSLYELNRNRRMTAEGTTEYYYRDVLSVMGNPLLNPVYGEQSELIRRKVIESNLVYMSESDILPEKEENILFRYGPGERNACHYLLQVVEFLVRKLALPENVSKTDPVQLEILYQVYTFLIRLKDILANYAFSPEEEILFRLIRRMLRTLHIPFSGEPLSGLQLLGILETRTLDFDHVIILSMNEGVLPKVSSIPSFIPRNLRFGFGLPTPQHQDSIYAYYFYRLIQRASNVVLAYDSSTGGLRTGERSRFMHQLFYELPYPVTEINPEFPIALLHAQPIVVEKTGDVAESLMKYTGEAAKMLSPSAINEFLNCSLRFYFRRIAGLPEPDMVTEEIDARVFGNLLHRTMHDLYSGLGTMPVTEERLRQLMKKDEILDEALSKAYREELSGDKNNKSGHKIEGFNLIVKQIIKAYVINLITADIHAGTFVLVDLEKRLSVNIPVPANEKILNLLIGGMIDRIDRSEKGIRIVDYKTGAIKKSFATIESLFDDGEARNDAVFQVLLYSLVYQKLNPESIVIPALYFVRGSYSDYSNHIKYGDKILGSFGEIQNEFEEQLSLKLSELFDVSRPFVQTQNLAICRNCPYAVICRREGT